MEGQGVAASAASAAGRPGEPGLGSVVAAELNDPSVSHVTSDVADDGENARSNGDETLVIPAFGQQQPQEPQGPQGPRQSQNPQESRPRETSQVTPRSARP